MPLSSRAAMPSAAAAVIGSAFVALSSCAVGSHSAAILIRKAD
ncbi:hypothetical protein ACTZWT_20945 [Rhodopseudomonas sp. NSM]